MSEDYADSGGWPRLLERIRAKRDDAQEHILSGQLSPTEYQGMCMRYALCVEILAEARKISRGEDLKPPDQVTSIMERVEGA
jgi:hypothetical protein